jgi:hypothetical protein
MSVIDPAGPSRTGHEPLVLQPLAEQSADQTGEQYERERERRGEPIHLASGEQPEGDEDRLGGDVGRARRDHAVAQRCAAALDPGGASAAEHEPEDRAEEEYRIDAAAPRVDDRREHRQRDGEHERHRGPRTERIGVPSAWSCITRRGRTTILG